MSRCLSFLHRLSALGLCLGLASAAPLEPRAPPGVPSYVLSYAPLAYLHSGENYFPTDIATHLLHTQPKINFVDVSGAPSPLTPSNLDSLNSKGGREIWLTSKDDVTTNPAWLKGTRPNSAGAITGATACAIIVNDKGNGNVDAFYMYFFAYNTGGTIFGQNLGIHVGDWEHNMIRFSNGVPTAIWYSQHGNGQAFRYSTVQKSGQRPLGYIAKGTHAVYAIPGKHDHTIPNLNLPFGPLVDDTNAGILWDPTQSAWYYKYDAASNSFTAYDQSTPTAWLNFVGRWGDQQYPDSDPRQRKFFGFPKYSGGPTGPIDKQLNREKVCPDNGNLCIVRRFLAP